MAERMTPEQSRELWRYLDRAMRVFAVLSGMLCIAIAAGTSLVLGGGWQMFLGGVGTYVAIVVIWLLVDGPLGAMAMGALYRWDHRRRAKRKRDRGV